MLTTEYISAHFIYKSSTPAGGVSLLHSMWCLILNRLDITTDHAEIICVEINLNQIDKINLV